MMSIPGRNERMRLLRRHSKLASAGWSLCAALILLAAPGETSAQGRTRTEVWPELEFRYRIDDDNSLTLSSQLREDTGARQLYQAEQTVSFSHDLADWLSAAAGFRHANATNGGPFEEERLFLSQTLHLDLPAALKVDLRTREDLRWLPGGFSWRLRERVRLQRPVSLGRYSFTPFAYAELYYDSRLDMLSRFRFAGGATFPVYRGFAVQPYYMHEIDTALGTARRDVLGLALQASF